MLQTEVKKNNRLDHKFRLKAAFLPALAGVALLALGASCQTSAETQDQLAQVERGRYLVSIAGCDDCHTPWTDGPEGPHPDMERRLSGHPENITVSTGFSLPGSPWTWSGTATNTAYSGPWGISYAANLTPDENTGIGVWTEENFVNTIRNGRHWGVARPILPPMPWQAYRNMTDQDLKAVFAFLRTIPAIYNEVPEPVLPPEPEPTDLAE